MKSDFIEIFELWLFDKIAKKQRVFCIHESRNMLFDYISLAYYNEKTEEFDKNLEKLKNAKIPVGKTVFDADDFIKSRFIPKKQFDVLKKTKLYL